MNCSAPLSDAEYIAWVLKLYANWIKRSVASETDCAQAASQAIALLRFNNPNPSDRAIRRAVGYAVIDCLHDSGPLTVPSAL